MRSFEVKRRRTDTPRWSAVVSGHAGAVLGLADTEAQARNICRTYREHDLMKLALRVGAQVLTVEDAARLSGLSITEFKTIIRKLTLGN